MTLLPRHWDWLNGQPGGHRSHSASLWRARRANEGGIAPDVVQEAAYRFMVTMAENLLGLRSHPRLFANAPERLEAESRDWPEDVRNHVRQLVQAALETTADSSAAENDHATGGNRRIRGEFEHGGDQPP